MMILKAQPQCTSRGLRLSSASFLLHSVASDAEAVYRMVNNGSGGELKESLSSSGIHLSKDLIDKVVKRARFSHANPLQALELYRYADARRGFYHSAFSLDTMLYILGRNRKLDLIWEVLIETKRKDDGSLITPRTMQVVLGRVAKLCSVRQTVESFWKFKRLLPPPPHSFFHTSASFNALLRTLCQEKTMTDARNVYHSLKHQFHPDLQTFNILLSGWRSSEEAEAFFHEMTKEKGLKPDLVTYNSLIDVYCKAREMDKAYKLIDKMREEDVTPDVITYTTIIGGLGLIGQPDKAREVLKEMKEYGCYPDVPAYNAAIRNYCIARRLRDADMLVDEMVKKGLSPNATTYNLFFRVLSLSNDLGRSWELYVRMLGNGCLPNTQSCMFLIKMFKRHERVDMALRLWQDMVVKGFGSYSLVSDVLFDLLCDLARVEEAEKCLLQMVEKGHRPSNVSFKRIKLLLELANKHHELNNLKQKMAIFSTEIQL
ncbi:putative pentatricopeptide repeat-containing protein [Raphanus sativus]|uniref:Pentatricopeptide repeat-containing protein At1g02420 n=1 Tax=Raphanus sativus TaxID=3726 RepID=A0A9W3CV40_RAPSA|nr:putative pentatricopeptide repeat-containing protein At1g02420 [Raphanus sativus]KAJ4869011.1 putative pentatricopeptide repeat-containing protein [Raphanus sativus]